MSRTLRPNSLGSLMRTLLSMRNESVDRVPPAPCPYCGKVLDGASNSKAEKPNPGDLSVCVYCAGLCQFTATLALERLPAATFEALPADDRAALREHQDAVRAIYARRVGPKGGSVTHRLPARPSPGQEAVLEAVRELAAAGARVSAITVSERLGISRQQAARQLSLLERKGFVADIPKVVRSGNWALTKAGERLG